MLFRLSTEHPISRLRGGVYPSPTPTKEPPPNVSYHLSKVAPISHPNQIYESFGTPKKHQKIVNKGSKIASGRPRGASGTPRASQVRDLLQQVGPQGTQNGSKRRPERPRGGARRAPWPSFSPLGATFRRLGSTFLSDLVANRFSTVFFMIFA